MTLVPGDLQAIGRIALFHGLTPQTIAQLVAPARTLLLRPRDILARQGDPADAFFIVVSGWLKLYRNNSAGEEAVLEMMKEGSTFAEASAFSGGAYLATAEAVADARVARVPAEHIVRCARDNPEVAQRMVSSISQHMHYLCDQVERLKAQSGLQRVAEFLASCAPADQGRCTLALPYDKMLIARQLGLMPESLSRAFARLRTVGVTVNAAQVTIEDIGRLRRIADEDRASARGAVRQ